MIVYQYDKSFDGLLTCIFEAYDRKMFPDILQAEGVPLPLFHEEVIRIITDERKSSRVWKGLEKRLSPAGLSVITSCWLSELPDTDRLLFRYIRKAIDALRPIEINFGDPDVLEATQIAKKPIYNVLPLVIGHFQNRFADQCWLLYDIKREYGYYYNRQKVDEVRFETKGTHLLTGKLDQQLMAEDEQLFQQLWRTYFKTIAIKERINPKLHRQNLPVRFWKYLTEK